MPIQVTWHDEQQGIARATFVGNWTMKHFRTAWNRCYEMLVEQADQRVDFIIDMRDIILIPPDFVRQFRALRFNPQPNSGLVLIVGADDHMQILISHIHKTLLASLDIAFADTLEDAEAQIRQARHEPMALTA